MRASATSNLAGKVRMIPILTVLTTLIVSMLITQLAGAALVQTGLSTESARFQARSAFSGVGFTTSEAESVVNHPVRRRIVMGVMLLGNVGLVAAITALGVSFVSPGGAGWNRVFVLLLGLVAIWVLFRAPLSRHLIDRMIGWALKRIGQQEALDYANLLQFNEGFRVAEAVAGDHDWLTGQSVYELRSAGNPLVVLRIQRPDEELRGIPEPTDQIQAGDTVVLYGERSALARACSMCADKLAARQGENR